MSRTRRVASLYLGFVLVALTVFLAVGVVLALTLPYHAYDSFAFGDWSRAIAESGKLDPLWSGPLASSRPLFYELQGALWSITGISFTAGRLLSFLFALLLLGSVAALARALRLSWLATGLAVVAALCVPAFAANALSGETDVPAAAMVALTAALALRPIKGRGASLLLLVTAALAVLVKQTVLVALVPLAIVLGVSLLRRSRSAWWPSPVVALSGGLLLGLVYDAVMAFRFHLALPAYLRTGSSGIWAELAAETRKDALLRADVFGEGLRVPFLFGLVYVILRTTRVGHRTATLVGLVAAIGWGALGPIVAGVHNGPFATAEAGFTFVGFSLLLLAILTARTIEVDRSTIAVLLALVLPPLAVWAEASTYATRLAAPSWPGVAVLIGITLAAAVEAIAAIDLLMALAPLAVIAVAFWMALAAYDGLDGALWRQYRVLGWHGIRNSEQTLNVVLPALQETIAAAKPELRGGRLVSQDPRFAFFLPGKVDTRTPLRCADVRDDRVFVLLTADESERAAREAGGLATPGEWAKCKEPRLHQLSDGVNGYAVFVVSEDRQWTSVRKTFSPSRG